MNETLSWGISIDECKKRFKTFHFCGKNEITFRWLEVTNFPGDCGALCVFGLNCAQEEELRELMEYASLSGFSKIFGTVVTDPEFAEVQCNLLRKLRWKKVYSGKSNRTPDYADHVFVKIIHKPKKVGY